MPWYHGDFPPSYKNQPVRLREKAVEIANELLGNGLDEGVAIATGLKRARAFFKEKEITHPLDKKYKELYETFQHFQLKKRQYSKAVHIFHDHTADFNRVVDDLSANEIEAYQKKFNQHELDFHDVADSFDRALDEYNRDLEKLRPMLKKAVSFTVNGKEVTMTMLKGELVVE